MWFINRRSSVLSVFCLGDCKRPQLIFLHSVFRKMQSFKKRKCFLQLGNFQSWEKDSPVASSVFSGAFRAGICNIKSFDISKWAICKVCCKPALSRNEAAMRSVKPTLFLKLFWIFLVVLRIFWFEVRRFLFWSFVLKLGTFLKLLSVRASVIWATELVPQLALWQWQSGTEC